MFRYKYDELISPVFDAIKTLGGSATVSEINEELIRVLNLTNEEIEDIHKGSTTKLAYRSAWARTYLKRVGYIDNSERGVWIISDKAKDIKQVDSAEIKKLVKEGQKKQGDISDNTDNEENLEGKCNEDEYNWQDEVLSVIKNITPSQFEKLCKRLLRELGFVNVEVTGSPNDGGIDGKGILRLGGIISFNVAFQAKRYDKTVSSSVIRDFRGSIMGRADKGIIITTGTFSREAIKEAKRDGATTIDLIDGNDLAVHLKSLKLGINTEVIEKVVISEEWFKNI